MRLRHALLLPLLAVPVAAADSPATFQKLFARHQAAGTLLRFQTGEEFRRQGWGEPFRQAVASQLGPADQEGLTLEIALLPGARAEARQAFPLRWTVRNGGKEAATILFKGSCKTVHGATLVVIEPDGRVLDWVYRPASGGHCFCSQQSRVLPPDQTQILETGGPSVGSMNYQPPKPGRYVLVARYQAAVGGAKAVRLQSRPLELTVAEAPPQR